MRKKLLLATLLCLAFPASAWAGAGDLIVSVNPSAAASALAAADAQVERQLAPGQLLVDPEGSAALAAQELREQPGVSYVEPDRRVQLQADPSDSYWNQLWGLQRIGAAAYWPGSPVTVAVIDTGVDYSHPELSGRMWTNPSETPGNGVDDDRNGFVDDVYGADFVGRDGNPMDENSHGTHVSGTIAATAGNAMGVAGVAPQARIMSLRFLDAQGSGYTSDAVLAFDYAVSKGAKVLNNSWGGGGYSYALDLAITRAQNAGVLVVAAAGNETQNLDNAPSYPASYGQEALVAVAASDSSEGLAWFSNYGAKTVDLAAPGVGILSTIPNGRYATYSGTSMATPHVAGAAALLWGLYPAASWRELRSALLAGGVAQPALANTTASGRRLSVPGSAALLASGGGSTPVDPPVEEPPAPPAPPANISLPSITRLDATTLSCNPGGWTGATSFAYSWTRSGSTIPGAVASTYTLTSNDAWHQLRCVVVASGPGGSKQATSPPVTGKLIKAPRALTRPMLFGSARAGSNLLCLSGIWSGDQPLQLSYAWLRNGAVIAGATGVTYRVTSTDARRALSCRVTARNSAGSASSDSRSLTVASKARARRR